MLRYPKRPVLTREEEIQAATRIAEAERAVYDRVAASPSAMRAVLDLGKKLEMQRIHVRTVTRVSASDDPVLEDERVMSLIRALRAEPSGARIAELRLQQSVFARIVRRARDARLNAHVRELQRLRNEFAYSNMRLVIALAKRFYHKVTVSGAFQGVDWEDLVQSGSMGLMRAIEMFDVAKGFRFATYAEAWINRFIEREIQDRGLTIRLPVHRHVEVGKIQIAQRKAIATTGRALSVDELAAALNMTTRSVDRAMRAKARTVSTEETVSGVQDLTFGGMLESTDPSPAEAHEDDAQWESVVRMLAHLPPRLATVLSLIYGLDGKGERNMREVGDLLGLSRERIRQLERDAFRMCRLHMRFGPIDRTPDALPPDEERRRAMDRASKARRKAARAAEAADIGEAAE